MAFESLNMNPDVKKIGLGAALGGVIFLLFGEGSLDELLFGIGVGAAAGGGIVAAEKTVALIERAYRNSRRKTLAKPKAVVLRPGPNFEPYNPN